MSLTYKVPKKLSRPFKRGDIVEVCDRDLVPMSTQKVTRAGKQIVVTECGRRWRAKDGWFVGHEAWPFPSIRHAPKKSVR